MRAAVFSLAFTLLVPTTVLAQASGGAVFTTTAPGKRTDERIAEVSATVEAMNAADRTVTLKGSNGELVTVAVGPDVTNFSEIKVGDFVFMRYYQALTLELKKGGKAVVARTETDAGGIARPGERPAAGGAREVHVVADVVALDPATQTVTLRGPTLVVDLLVHDPKQFALVSVGDQVEATYIEAAAISVEPAPKQ
ncbi:MAG TPA: hypothetical protein VLJ12_02405 [Burkholderiales bacterium]|nr:hypothetical protein [Burkholderiales bacterium]